MKKNPINARIFELGLQQKELAQALNVPVSTLSNWTASRRNPSQRREEL